MGYGVARAISLTKYMRVCMVGFRIPVFIQTSKNGSASSTSVRPFAEGFMYSVADGYRLNDAGSDSAENGIASHRREFLRTLRVRPVSGCLRLLSR